MFLKVLLRGRGLNPAVKPFVRAFKPCTITDAMLYARLQEETLTNIQKMSKIKKLQLK